MTTIVHEAFVELFRSDAGLVKEVIGEKYGIGALHPQVESAELTLLPSEYRADSVIVFRNEKGKARFAVVVEVQTETRRRKRMTWPVYVSAVRATHECPTLLIVVAIDDKVARWARASINLGHPGFTLKPFVLTKDQIPLINDLESARRLPRLAVLSALTHHSIEIASAALAVLHRVSPDYVEVYRDLIVSKLPEHEQELLKEQMQMQHYEWQSVQAKRQLAEIREESRKEGEKEGEIKGKKKGRLLAQQDLVIQLAEDKAGRLAPEMVARIRRMRSEARLFKLIVNLSRAETPMQAQAVLN